MSRLVRWALMVTVALATATEAAGQYYTTGDDPLSMKLWQLRTSKYRIIVEEESKPIAERLASTLDSLMQKDAWSLNHTPGRIDIMLHTRHAYSNGLVTWAPKRMELYTFAPTDGDCVPWTTHLAIHEYRHVVQTSMLNVGTTRMLYGLFGEQATGLVLGLYVPLWLLEGDAVANETSLTGGGRGRMASFEQEMRAMTLCGNRPKYDMAYNGSYKTRTPDYYHMGYLTVSNVRLRHGQQVWRRAIEESGRLSLSVTPFNRTLRHMTGHSKVGLYDQAMADWEARWRKQDSTITPTPHALIAGPTCDYTEHTSACHTGEGLACYTTSVENIASISIIKEADEGKPSTVKTLVHPSPRAENTLASDGGSIIWCERHQHARWSNASKTALMLHDSGRTTCIKKGMLSAPAIVRCDENRERIAIVSTKRDNRQTISITDYDRTTRRTTPLREIEIKGDNTQVTSTAWIDTTTIVMVLLDDNGKSIVTLDTENEEHIPNVIYGPKFENIRHLATCSGKIYYTSDKTGIDNIYILYVSGETERITSSRFGAAWACPSDDRIIYSEYTSEGYQLVETRPDTRACDTPISPMREIADTLSAMERHHDSTGGDIEEHKPSRYRRITHMLRPHSWGPVIVNADNNSIEPGVAIASQNTLGNSIASAGIKWDKSETSERYFINYEYTGLYPKISFGATWGYYDYDYDELTLRPNSDLGIRCRYKSRQHVKHQKIAISMPLSHNRGAWQRGINPNVSFDIQHHDAITYYVQEAEKVGNHLYLIGKEAEHSTGTTNYKLADLSIGGHIVRRTTERAAGYRYGITARAGKKTSLADRYGTCAYGSITLYLPGIGRHHNINATAEWQKKKAGGIRTTMSGARYRLYTNDATGTPRGHNAVRNKRNIVARVNYTMPMASPDWSWGGLAYIKRIYLRLFADMARGTTATYNINEEDKVYTQHSIGTDIWMTAHWLRLPYPVSVGTRIVDNTDEKKITAAMLLSISIK